MKQKVIKELVLFLGVFLITLLRAGEQDVCYNTHRDTVSFDQQDTLFEMSSLPILFRGDLSPANAVYSITRSGVYQLTSAKTASGIPNITITANNVMLDLGGNTLTGGTNGIEISGNNVTVKNGTIIDMTQSGVHITGDNCLLQDITARGTMTGFEFNGTEGATVRLCRALDSTREGFLLTNAQKSSFEKCEALNTSGAGTVAGFKTTGGTHNSFVECTINGVLSSNADAYGLLGLHETQACISDNSVINIAGSAYTAGIGLIGDSLATPTAHDFTYAESRNSRFPEWLNTGVETYLAISNEAAPRNARIFQFSPTDGLTSVTTTQDNAGACRQATWLSWHNKEYLAMVGDNDGGGDIFVYEFNLATNTLTTITSYTGSSIGAAGVAECDWLLSGTLAYLAYVVYPNSASTEELGVLRFDGSTLIKVSSLEYISTGLLSVKHHLYNGKIRLAVTQHPPMGRPDLIIHSFNEPQGSEALTTGTLGLVSYDLTGNEYIEKSAWFDFDGQTYLVFGIVGVVSTSNVRVLQYTENPTPTLTAVASFNYGGVVQDVDALVTGTTVYLAVGGAVAGQRTKILTFDPYAASADRIKPYYDCSADTANTTGGVSWNRCPSSDNKIFLASSKQGNPCMRVYGFTLNNKSQLNLVNNNILSGVLSGDGVLLDFVTNTAQANTSYNCQEGFEASVRTDYPASEYAGELTNFVTSQANARGIYNIDTNLTTPDTVSLIAGEVAILESKVDVLFQDSVTVESKLDYLMACDYEALPAPTTLSTDYGAYCLSADMAGDLAITGSGITLCLNGHTISGGTNGIFISGDEVVVKNGTVKSATASGIKITGDKCMLQDITTVGNVTGFEFNGANNCTVSLCRAIDNTREGFLLTNAQKNNFEQCEALTTNGAGLVAGMKTTGGTGNNFVDCAVNGVTSSAGEAYGLLASNEQKTCVARCAVNSVSGKNYTAGVALIGDYLGTPMAQSLVSSFTGRSSFSVDWLNTPVGSYIASANNSATNVNAKVDTFSASNGLADFGYTGTIVSSLLAVSWLNWNNAYYLAIGGGGGVGTTYPDVKVFSCALSNVLSLTTEVASATNAIDGTVFDLEWFFSGTMPYLAYVGAFSFNPECDILEFTGNSLRHVAGAETGSTMRAVKAHTYKGHIRLALAVQRTDGVWIYGFDEPQGSQILVRKTISSAVPNVPTYLSWLDYDGKTYLAVAFENNVADNVRVFEYTEEPSVLLSEFATYSYGAATRGLDWLVTGTTVYMAVSGDNASKRTIIMKFDPYQGSTTTRLSEYYNLGDTQAGYRLRWNRVAENLNRVYLAVGKSGTNLAPYLRVFGFDINDQSQLNMVSNTLVSGVSGGDGVLLDEFTNAAYSNTAYNCQDGFMPAIRTNYSVPQFATSNRVVPSV